MSRVNIHMNIYITENFIERANIVHNFKYSYILTTYTGIFNKVIITCPLHGEFKQKANDHLDGCGCPNCGLISGAKARTKTTAWFINSAMNIHKDRYFYEKSIYKGWNIKLIITCQKHGDFLIRPNNHLTGQGCYTCGMEATAASSRYSLEEFITLATEIHRRKFSYERAIYVNSKTKIIITCPLHGDFKQEPISHLNGCGCPKCIKSKGEQATENFLQDYNIDYKVQFKIPECKNKKVLPFDFAIFLNQKLIGLIEFQGGQHYKPIKFYGGKIEFEKLQKRDMIKLNYCAKNNVPLLLISYKEKNISVCIKNFLDNLPRI